METILAGFQGYLTADAYVAYERIGKLWPGVVKTSCWVHGRRKFDECHHLGGTVQTRTALAYFRKLFDIEDKYRTSSDEVRLAVRLEQSKPIVESFREWLEAERQRQLPKAKLTGAINYMLNRWESFTRFLESGAVRMDNNSAERALKYPILGRKAWLFFGNQTAGETAAKLFTLTKTCNRLRIDPFAYLQDVYARLPTTSPENFLFDHGTLVRVYKAKLADHLRACGLDDQVPPKAWNKTFVVDIQPVGDGRAVLKYLAPYVHRVAISDNRIVACDESSVTFRYQPSKSKTFRTRRVDGNEFVRGFVQHSLPRGFHKIRHYGWMSSNSKVTIDEVKWLVWLFLGWTYWLASGHAPQQPKVERPVLRCAECGGKMRVVDITFEPTGTLSEHALAYLDSG